jgi:3'-phosphoadenosine 5'-phosphosulfate sulfotransferase (PAPS reductase)/FAD synthetase
VTDDLRAKLNGRRVVASISGGKDSAAMSLWLHEQGIEHDRVFMDTGWEHPETYAYLRGPLTEKLGPITEIRSAKYPGGMVDLFRAKGMFPSRRIRFCTQELKVFPMQTYLRTLTDDHVNAVGVRRAESEARSKLTEWEWSDGFDCETWRPLIDWSEADVIEAHRRHGLSPNPLYIRGEGVNRVGCWPCINSTKAEIRMVADLTPERIDLIEALEREVGPIAEARYAAKGTTLAEKNLASPAFFQSSLKDDKGRRPCIPIRAVVQWSRTARGGRQYELFAPEREEGCVRWGLCEAAPEKEGTDR